MLILLVGNGGREHALALKLSQSPRVEKIYVAPGNSGTAQTPKCENVPFLPENVSALAVFASTEGIDLTIVGPEQPLSLGIVDQFNKRGLRIFGPVQKAAELESSKKFSKELMKSAGVPTAKFETFSDFEAAHQYLKTAKYPLVVKADGLASGKGVTVCTTPEEAISFAHSIMETKKVSATSSQVVIEEFLEGEEVSFFVICDGQSFLPLTSAQDHKRLLDGDKGPNTGGMGAYSPAPIFSAELQKTTEQKIVIPILNALTKKGVPFVGILFVGLMITPQGPSVIEFNVRFGDPETQAMLPRLESDLAELIDRATRGKLQGMNLTWSPQSALTVVLASQNYPGTPITGFEIEGVSQVKLPTQVFHAGTDIKNSSLVTNGGRVLAVTGLGNTLQEARESAYHAVSLIHFEGEQHRNDIGWRALHLKK